MRGSNSQTLPQSITSRHWSGFLFAALAFALILLWPFEMRRNPDARAYLHAAAAFAQGCDDPAFSQWPPGLPIVLAAFQLAGINPLHGMRWLNAIAYGLMVWLVLSSIKRFRAALGIAMLSPLLFYSYLFVLADGLFVLLVVMMLLELPRRH